MSSPNRRQILLEANKVFCPPNSWLIHAAIKTSSAFLLQRHSRATQEKLTQSV